MSGYVNKLPNFSAIGLLAFGGTRVSAQDSGVSFEVASVKPLQSALGPVHFTVLPNRLDVHNINLKFLIKWAYDLRDDQISGPDGPVSYDILATTGEPVSKDTMRIMLRNLLVERFHLATHRETRTAAMYRLVVLPKGPKMKTADRGYAMPNSPMVDGGSVLLEGPMSMGQLVEQLARYAGKPVVDGTKLDGYFTVKLTFASDGVQGAMADRDFAAPLLAMAVQEQLGLKLVPESGPINIMVIDHAEAIPTAN
jgi:uncharacterized protein (TIGR03435 family)